MSEKFDPEQVDWDKSGGLVPAVVQHALTREVLMLGYMNAEALAATIETELVTFFSRSRQELWQKGETSGNLLRLRRLALDCDNDTILVEAEPTGPVCHKGWQTCFGDEPLSPAWLALLNDTIRQRAEEKSEKSYSWRLLEKGQGKVAQKFGEEAVELVVAATYEEDGRVAEEAADAIYHMLLLLRARGVDLAEVMGVLKGRA